MDDEPHAAILIPPAALAADVLRRVIEAFVLREGTDYGEKEVSLEQKVVHVMGQLERGDVQILFDPNSQTVDLVTSRAVSRRDSTP